MSIFYRFGFLKILWIPPIADRRRVLTVGMKKRTFDRADRWSANDPKRTYISRTGNSENKNNDLPLFQVVDGFTL